MPILVCGNEAEWGQHNAGLIAVGADTKRRGSTLLKSGGFIQKIFTSTADMWYHVRCAPNSGSAVGAGAHYFSLRTATNDTVFALRNNGGSTTPMRRISLTTVQAYTTDYPGASGDFKTWDLRVQLTQTVIANDTVTYTLYRDGSLLFTETYIAATAWPAIVSVNFTAAGGHPASTDVVFQDLVVTSSVPTVGIELVTMITDSVGNYTQFANNYTNISEAGYDPSTAIIGATVGLRESWTFAAPTYTLGDKVIYGVVLGTIAQTDLLGIVTDFNPFLRIGVVDYNAAENLGANNIAPTSSVTEFLTNPATSQPWTQAEVTAVEVGLRTV